MPNSKSYKFVAKSADEIDISRICAEAPPERDLIVLSVRDGSGNGAALCAILRDNPFFNFRDGRRSAVRFEGSFKHVPQGYGVTTFNDGHEAAACVEAYLQARAQYNAPKSKSKNQKKKEEKRASYRISVHNI